MGHIYAIAGPSGVGKTTFMDKLYKTRNLGLKLLVRSTSRPKRPNEKEAADYNYYSTKGFLHKVSSNDFIHIETYGDYMYGIEEKVIEDVLYKSTQDGIIVAGIHGALHLKDIYKESITIFYLFPGDANSIFNPDFLDGKSDESIELMRRLHEKYNAGDVEPNTEDEEKYVIARMKFNYLELAFTIGKLRHKHNIKVLENKKNNLDIAIAQFQEIKSITRKVPAIKTVQENHAFVLMPFTDNLKPVYTDHIKPTLKRLGYKCSRADEIFLNRPIMDDIIDSVQRSYIIISDLTNANPNVFYETGFCHALGKRVILITQDSDVPFDLKSIRHIKYTFTPKGMKKLELDLKQTITNVLNS